MQFEPYVNADGNPGWIPVPDEKNPPPAARLIDAETMNRLERLGMDTEAAINQLEADSATYASLPRIDTSVGKRVFIEDAAGVEHMVDGDSGKRSLAAYVPPEDGTVAALTIRRTGPDVEIYCTQFTSAAAGSVDLLSGQLLPAGFTPGNSRAWAAVDFAGNTTPVTLSYNGALLTIAKLSADVGVSFTIQYKTSDPWPTILPGTPA